MVKIRSQESFTNADGSLNDEAWFQALSQHETLENSQILQQAFGLARLLGENVMTPTGTSCLHQGLAMADTIGQFWPDEGCLASALIYPCTQYADLSLDIVREQLNPEVEKLIAGSSKMEALHSLQRINQNRNNIENIRMMFLAMVEDIRVVLIKLAEQLSIMRAAAHYTLADQQKIAKETMEIYAPLSNRLGLSALKWEMEDLAFRRLEPDEYKSIAKMVDEKRLARDQYVKNVILLLRRGLKRQDVKEFEISGRAKHIYSIYRKMQRKRLPYEHIYDVTAIRVLVPTIEDCYTVLSVVHDLWEQIPEEFDDYVANPKANGYRSIHTAVKGPDLKNVEIQIRTYDMHYECENGIAAHWAYKEGNKTQRNMQANKIAWLRQVLDWQNELSHQDELFDEQPILNDRIYVFTPQGEVIDLPPHATPLDFAYYLHSEIGHRCRGAKINGNIVPLTYRLQSGEQVEILTAKKAAPSRDWLSPHSGYLATARAKAKVHHYFKQQDYEKNVMTGHQLLDQECKRIHLHYTKTDLQKIADKQQLKTTDDLLAALGCGNLKPLTVVHWLQQSLAPVIEAPTLVDNLPSKAAKQREHGVQVHGVGNLLTYTARCCSPIPGDEILGFITLNRGVAIHRVSCHNMMHTQKERLIDVNWDTQAQDDYPLDLYIRATDRQGLLRDVTGLLANEKVNVLGVNTRTNPKDRIAHLHITLEVKNTTVLQGIVDKIRQLSHVISITRH